MRPAFASGALALMTVLAGPAGAQDPGLDERPSQERYVLRGQYREFHPTLSGRIQKGAFGAEGTLVDVIDDLALDSKRTFDVRGALQFGKGKKLRGSWTPLDYDGDTPASRTFTYGATRYSRFSRIVTSVKGNYYSGDIEWDFIKRSRGYLGFVVGAKVFDVDTVVVSPSQEGSREQDTIRAPIPVLGLTGRYYMSRLSLEGEAVGLALGERGSMFEVESSARFHISDRLALQVGYRLLRLDGKDDLDRVKLNISGITFGVELSL